ncbi:hypothetical protein ONZ45_g7259 [Pleurotus djamor]|nr:hypothetical protein ONZ45_g7259 [Pleurotus djamor]
MEESFEFSDAMVIASQGNRLWMYTSIVGACLCFLVLLFIGVATANKKYRHHLDRVSFRIVSCALVANLIFGIVNAVGGSFTGPTWTCGFTIWLLQLTLELSCFLTFCVALNLQLVIVYRVNGHKLEKYYLIGSLVISLALTIPAYSSGQYGKRISTLGQAQDQDKAFGVFDYVSHKICIVAEIALYPLVSCLINLTSVMCVIHATVTNGVHSMTDYRILLLSDFLYGGRAIAYALLVAFDPALSGLLGSLRKGTQIDNQEASPVIVLAPSRIKRPPIQISVSLSRWEDESQRKASPSIDQESPMAKADQYKRASCDDGTEPSGSVPADMPYDTSQIQQQAESREGVLASVEEADLTGLPY